MNALIKKEIRLLLPGWAAVLLLETALPWFGKDADAIFGWMPAAFFFGMVILAVDVFGREFNLGVFPSLLAQPIERQRIWRTKMGLLGLAAALIFLSYAASCGLRVSAAASAANSVWRYNSHMIWQDYRYACGGSILLLLVAVSGGLWTALLLRQTAAAFWVTFLTPLAILMLALLLLESKFFGNERFAIALMIGLSVVYSGAGFWLARRLFFRAQDAAWSGGVINLSRWRYYERSGMAMRMVRRYRPWLALWKKEFQLHSMSLFCACGLLALHLVVFLVRAVYANTHRDSVFFVLTEFYWAFWLVMPFIVGCIAVAEERKLGVMDEQFCLPVSRRKLFLIKFLPVMFFGLLLGAVIPLLLEAGAARVGLANDYFKLEQPGNDFLSGPILFVLWLVSSAAGLTLLGFFASSLSRNFLQALSLAIATSVLTVVLFGSLKSFIEYITPLPSLLTVVVLPAALIWLAWRNFHRFQDDWRLWLKNGLGIVAALVFIATSSLAIYNRVWEIFQPVEPPHGPARMTLAAAPTLTVKNGGDVLVELPDGRVWYDIVGYQRWISESSRKPWIRLWALLVRPLPANNGPQQFLSGSNWVSVVAGHRNYPMGGTNVFAYRDTVGIKRDGTLWLSADGQPGVWNGNNMRPLGTESNWVKVAPLRQDLVLLKSDGTLWQWTNRIEGAGMDTRNFSPNQIGRGSNWIDFLENDEWWSCYARMSNGSVWLLKSKSLGQLAQFERAPGLDEAVWQKLSSEDRKWRQAFVGRDGEAFVGRDGVLRTRAPSQASFTAMSTETNWVAVTLTSFQMIALKSDGTLWKWELSGDLEADFPPKVPPVRLGIHHDWVALGKSWHTTLALAADGSLWVWPATGDYTHALMKAPKQPKYIANIFQTGDQPRQ